MPRIRPVMRDDRRRGQSSRPGFLLPFGRRHSLLGHPIPAGGLGLPYGRLTGPEARTPTGLPRSTRTSCDRGGSPLYPEDGGAHPGWDSPSPGTCRFSATSPYTLLQHPTLQGCCLRGINRGSRYSPVRSSPRLWPPDGTASPRAFPRASHPAGRTGRRTSGWGQAIEHGPGTTLSASAEPPICAFSHKRATSCRNCRAACRPSRG